MGDQQQDPEYLLAQVGQELERLSKQHAWLKTCHKGQIVFAPVDIQKDGLTVLDVGCADGTLLRDLQKQVAPSAKLIGADVMPSFLPPERESGNIRYVVQDICEPFPRELENLADLTHVRYVLAGSARVGLGVVINHLVSSLAPGGWLQVQELEVHEDSPIYTPALKDLMLVTRSLFSHAGMDIITPDRLEKQFIKAGLVNVSVQRKELPVGKKLSNAAEVANSIEPFKITIPSLIMGAKKAGATLPNSVTENLQERFEKEMIEEGSSFFTLIVTGQKKNAES